MWVIQIIKISGSSLWIILTALLEYFDLLACALNIELYKLFLAKDAARQLDIEIA